MTFVPFATQYKDEQYSGERVINWFVRPTPGATGEAALISRSGVVALQAPTAQAVRAMAAMADDIYMVAGGTVWKYVIATDTISSVGTVPDGVTSIAASGAEVAIVVNNTYYICNGTTTSAISTGAMSSPKHVVFIDGYFLLAGTVAGRPDGLTVSGLDDGTTFDALDFAFAENAPDAIQGMIADHGRVYVFGSYTTEVFYNAGLAAFPFAPSKSEVMEEGSSLGAAIAKMDNAVYWVGSDNIVYRTFGAAPEVVSTPEIAEALDASQIVGGLAFKDAGQKFYAIGRAGKTTLVFDLMTGLWAERSTGVNHSPWVVTHAVHVRGKTYFGTSTGKLCEASRDVMTDDGAIIVGEAISRPVVQGGREFTINKLELRAQTSNSTADTTPEIIMQTSRNGKEWGREYGKPLGGIGKYKKRIAWHGLGSFEQAQVRLRVTDPVRRDLYGIFYE